jgi:hypothetical protein
MSAENKAGEVEWLGLCLILRAPPPPTLQPRCARGQPGMPGQARSSKQGTHGVTLDARAETTNAGRRGDTCLALSKIKVMLTDSRGVICMQMQGPGLQDNRPAAASPFWLSYLLLRASCFRVRIPPAKASRDSPDSPSEPSTGRRAGLSGLLREPGYEVGVVLFWVRPGRAVMAYLRALWP